MKKGVDKRGTGWYIGKAVSETAAGKPKRERKKFLTKGSRRGNLKTLARGSAPCKLNNVRKLFNTELKGSNAEIVHLQFF